MPSKLMDKFNSIINRGMENKIISEDNSRKADEFWEEVSKRTGNKKGDYALFNKMKEFNVKSYRELSKLLGYSSTSLMAGYLNKRNKPSTEFKKRLYNFFADENNIQIPTKKIVRRKKGYSLIRGFSADEIKNLDDFYKNTDIKQLFSDAGLLLKNVAEEISMDKGYLSNICNKKCKPGYLTLYKIKEYLDKLTPTQTITVPNLEIPTITAPEIPDLVNYKQQSDMVFTKKENELEKTPSVISRYASELNDITELMHEYQTKINELEIRRKICIEVLDAISECTGGEKQCSHN